MDIGPELFYSTVLDNKKAETLSWVPIRFKIDFYSMSYALIRGLEQPLHLFPANLGGSAHILDMVHSTE